MTSDPIGLEGGMNTYTYVLNNPLYWIDPLGLDSSWSMAQSLTNMSPNNFPTTPQAAESLNHTELLPQYNALGMYGEAWLTFMSLAVTPEAKGAALACKKGVETIGPKTLCVGILGIFCRDSQGFDAGQEVLEGFRMQTSIRREVELLNRHKPNSINTK